MKINNLPQNLYHITTTERLAKIKNDKLLKAMPDTLTNGRVKGIFAFDLKNFCAQWTKDNHMNLARLILDYIAKGKELVVLRIPLNKLPEQQVDNIKVRDVNKIIKWKFGEYKPENNDEILGLRPDVISPDIAYEHILPEDIAVNNFEQLGTSHYSAKLSLPDIIMGFFKNQPEENAVKKLFINA